MAAKKGSKKGAGKTYYPDTDWIDNWNTTPKPKTPTPKPKAPAKKTAVKKPAAKKK